MATAVLPRQRESAPNRFLWEARGRYGWFAQAGADQYYVAWDVARRDDWCALVSCAGGPFLWVPIVYLPPIIADLQAWIRSRGGEIPRAPEVRRG